MERVGTGQRPWLFTVARNLIISKHRRRAARTAKAPINEEASQPAGNEIGRVLRARQVAEAMNELSTDHREVIIQLVYRRRTVTEAAEILGVPPGAVKSRAHHALHALRAALEERGMMGW